MAAIKSDPQAAKALPTEITADCEHNENKYRITKRLDAPRQIIFVEGKGATSFSSQCKNKVLIYEQTPDVQHFLV